MVQTRLSRHQLRGRPEYEAQESREEDIAGKHGSAENDEGEVENLECCLRISAFGLYV